MTVAHALVGAFHTCLEAHAAAVSLREGGFHEIWIGVTGPAPWIKNTLIRHGVDDADAARVACRLRADDVMLITTPGGYPELAAEIIAAAGGAVLSGDSFFCTPPATVPTISEDVYLGVVLEMRAPGA